MPILTGHHGGAEHVMIGFPDSVIEKMSIEDKILIRGFGQGLKLTDYPDIAKVLKIGRFRK